MVFYFVDFYRIMVKVSLVYVGIGIILKDILGFNIFCFMVINNFCLFLLEREVVNFEVLYVFFKFFCCGKFVFWLLEYMEFFWKDMILIMWLNVNELKE